MFELLKNEIVNNEQTKHFRTFYPWGDSPAHQEEQFEWSLNVLGPPRAAPEAFETGPQHHKHFFPVSEVYLYVYFEDTPSLAYSHVWHLPSSFPSEEHPVGSRQSRQTARQQRPNKTTTSTANNF